MIITFYGNIPDVSNFFVNIFAGNTIGYKGANEKLSNCTVVFDVTYAMLIIVRRGR